MTGVVTNGDRTLLLVGKFNVTWTDHALWVTSVHQGTCLEQIRKPPFVSVETKEWASFTRRSLGAVVRQETDRSRIVKQRQRDPERTKQEILDAATEEFSERGLAGARVDEIANRTRTTKRMIYYYFGSKEDLYRAVLQRAYDQVHINIENVDVESVDPVTAVRRLAEFAFDRSDANWNFTRLVSQENMQRGRYISPPSSSRGVNLPIIRMLESALQRGRAQGVFVRDIDAVDLHMLISSFCFFRVSNQYTFEANYGRNLVEPTRRDLYRQRIGDVVIAYLTNASS